MAATTSATTSTSTATRPSTISTCGDFVLRGGASSPLGGLTVSLCSSFGRSPSLGPGFVVTGGAYPVGRLHKPPARRRPGHGHRPGWVDASHARWSSRGSRAPAEVGRPPGDDLAAAMTVGMRVLVDRASHVHDMGGDVTDDDLVTLYATPAADWLRVNMVSTVDGAATGDDGLTGSVNNPTDHRVFHALRRMADAIVVGAGTARAEGYRPTDRPTVVVSRRGRLPVHLRGGPVGSVLLVTCASAEGLAEAREILGSDQVAVLGSESVDLGAMRAELADRGLRGLLSEGGPHLFRDMLAAGAVDELCATTVPSVLAGVHPRIAAGPPVDVRLDLRLLLEENGTLLGRWFVS